MDVKINGVEFQDVDFTDAETVAEFELGRRKFAEFNKSAINKNNIVDYIHNVCDCVREWIDNILGDGAADQIMGDRDSLTTATTVAFDLIKAYSAAMDEYKNMAIQVSGEIQALTTKSGNRQQRRDAKRKQGQSRQKSGSSGNAGRYDRSRVER